MRSLILLVLLSPLFTKVFTAGTVIGLITLASLGMNYAMAQHLRELSVVYRYLMGGVSAIGLLYFSAGIFLAVNNIHYHLGRLPSVTMVVVAVLAFGTCATMDSLPVFAKCAIDAIGTLTLMMGLYSLMPVGNELHILKGMSFPIYMLHIFVVKMLVWYTGLDRWSIWLLAVLFSVAVAKMLMVYCPSAARLIFGGRGVRKMERNERGRSCDE